MLAGLAGASQRARMRGLRNPQGPAPALTQERAVAPLWGCSQHGQPQAGLDRMRFIQSSLEPS